MGWRRYFLGRGRKRRRRRRPKSAQATSEPNYLARALTVAGAAAEGRRAAPGAQGGLQELRGAPGG
eukprot:3501994-Pyramimonas_sp.AAC.1